MKKIDDKENPDVKDFPPTYEDEKIRIWNTGKLDLDLKKEDVKKEHEKHTICIEDNEEVNEILIYPMTDPHTGRYLEDFDLKITSKINLKTKKVTFMLKGRTFMSKKITCSEGEYKEFIEDIEEQDFFRLMYDVENKQIHTKEDLQVEK